jgi:hypothetical protein
VQTQNCTAEIMTVFVSLLIVTVVIAIFWGTTASGAALRAPASASFVP